MDIKLITCNKLLNIEEYLNYVLDFSEKDFIKELEFICSQININPKRVLVFMSTGGPGYVVDNLAKNIYLDGLEIKVGVRVKLIILSIVLDNFSNLFYLNNEINKEGSYWLKERMVKEKNEKRVKCLKEINEKVDRLND